MASKHAPQGRAVERVADVQILVEMAVALLAAEPLELCRVLAEVHPGRHRTPLKAMAAERLGPEAGRLGAGLDDAGDAALIQRLRADLG